ncbi:uncharacterized protein TNCV_1471 [Trichonephila clavipes]|nr:uncharacterized protein TNCV_1471 [Trichonephila clavipes]
MSPDHQRSYLLKMSGTEPKCTVTCIVLKTAANDGCNIVLCHNEFRGPRSGPLDQIGVLPSQSTFLGSWYLFLEWNHAGGYQSSQEPIRGRWFATREDITNAVRQQVSRFPYGAANAEAGGIQHLPLRWQRAMIVAEDYIEGI